MTIEQTIQGLIEDYLNQHGIAGISAAVVQPGTSDGPDILRFFAGEGTLGKGSVDATTQFELGSETKTFTAGLLAAVMAQGPGRVQLSDPLQNHVPDSVKVPVWTEGGESTPIPLGNLATHQAGLPDMPHNLPSGPNGRAEYTQDLLWDAISQTKQLLWKPGTNWLYSNFGFGILGTSLANYLFCDVRPPGTPPPFGAAVAEKLTGPLLMTGTIVEALTPNLATPYGPDRQPVPYWNNTNALAGGGALVSNINDMATWVSATLGYPSALSFLPQTLHPVSNVTTVCKTPNPTSCVADVFQMGMAWAPHQSAPWLNEPFAHKNGGTTGMESSTFLLLNRKAGVTVLSNTNCGVPVDDLSELIITALVKYWG